MFQALLCSSSGGQSFIIQHLVSSHSVGGRPVRRLGEEGGQGSGTRVGVFFKLSPGSSLNSCTGRPPTGRDDTKFCII